MRGIFVTGTDTEVGKSVLAASICAALAARGERVAAFKPVVTGLDEEPGDLVRDLARDLALPLVIAARPGLGTINHTLLTIEAARAGGLGVAAVVMTPWPDEPGGIERSNRDTIT